MKNKIRITLIIIFVIVLASSAIVWSFSPKKELKPNEYAIGITYKQAMINRKPFMALFYTNWCSYCEHFMPKFDLLSRIYQDKYNFVMINVEDPANNAIVNDYAIGSFPTIYIIDPTIDNRILISNTLYGDLRRFREEMDRYLRIRALINQ